MPLSKNGRNLLADHFRQVYTKYKRLEEEKEKLVEMLKEAGVLKHEYKDGFILALQSSTQKKTGLGILKEFLGDRKAEQLWRNLPERVSQWYNITRPENGLGQIKNGGVR